VKEAVRHTRIVVRRMLTEPKIALAIGGILDILAGFKASIASFNAEIAPSRPLDGWDSTSMVETRGNCERIVQRGSCEEGLEP